MANARRKNPGLAQLAEAIREKQEWYFKILDDEEDLATKWVHEASKQNKKVNLKSSKTLIEELKREARRIVAFDHSLQPFGNVIRPRDVDFAHISSEVKDALKFSRTASYIIREAELKELIGVGAFISDDLVPELLHRELVYELDALANREPKDFHPGSDGKVLDLIHPSLYPYIAGVSPVRPGTMLPPFDETGMFSTTMITDAFYNLESSYAWVPSVFRVSEDGMDVEIQSYINGLGSRDEYPDLYKVIEKVFLIALPHLERTMNHKYHVRWSDSVSRWSERRKRGDLFSPEFKTVGDMMDFRAKQLREKDKAAQRRKVAQQKKNEKRAQEISGRANIIASVGDEAAASSWKGRDLKVIVKAANYILKPGDDYEGTWHMEGMPHERIVASVIYYYDTDPEIVDEGLGIKKWREPHIDFPPSQMYRHDDFSISVQETDDSGYSKSFANYPSDWEVEEPEEGIHQAVDTSELTRTIRMGTIATSNFNKVKGTGRILSFPNWVQHKVKGLSNPGSKVAQRKILCFFLVDDTNQTSSEISYHGIRYTGLEGMNVLTTSEVLNQQGWCNKTTLHEIMPGICEQITGRPLPAELIETIWETVQESTMTREGAERHRRELMADRKPTLEQYLEGNGRDPFSLCEH